jgi:hypothetical protein
VNCTPRPVKHERPTGSQRRWPRQTLTAERCELRKLFGSINVVCG